LKVIKRMLGSRYRVSFLTFFVVLIAAVPGCQHHDAKPPENPAADHLRKLGIAYDVALYKGRMPRKGEDLKPYLKQIAPNEDPEVFLRSPNDGQPYEVAWGVRLDRVMDIGAVFAHEKKGVDGKRYVMTVARIVKTMTDAEFSHATYPGGKKPVGAD
jgi:hypothetical protein